MSASEYLRCAPKYTISRINNSPLPRRDGDTPSPHHTPLGTFGASLLAPSASAPSALVPPTQKSWLRPWKLANSNLVYKLGLGSSLPTNNFYDQNWRGFGLAEHPKKLGTPYLFLQPLKLATSNLVYNLGLGVACRETSFTTKIGGGPG